MREINKGNKITRLFGDIAYTVPRQFPKELTEMPSFDEFNVRVDAFLDNRPVTLDKLDLEPLPENTRIMLQAILEEDAEQTVVDAQEILRDRIIHPAQSTGFLEASIGWMPEVFGTRIYADAYYSAWVEEGHDNFTGHHYMRDAFTRAKLRLPEKIKAELNGLILNDT